MRRYPLLLALVVLLGACDLVEEPFRPQLVVEAVLVSDRTFPPVRLSRTFAITEPIPADGGAVSGAAVVIERLGPDGEPDLVVHYTERGAGSGEYHPVPPARRVEPGRRYRLSVDVPEEVGLVPAGRLVRGETVAPDTFRVVEAPPSTIVFSPQSPPISVRTTRSVHPSRQGIYMFSIIALDPDGHDMTPFYAEVVDPENRRRFIENSSPLLNEENYEMHPDGTITLPVPWFAIAFYGPNRFVASAVDDALYDFIRSRDAQFGPGTLSPGEIPDVLSNVSNAVGVFGSVAQVSVHVFVAPP